MSIMIVRSAVPVFRCPRLQVGLLGALVIFAGLAEAEERRKWWHSEQVQQEIGLSASQVERLENIFQAALPTMHHEKRELDRMEGALSDLFSLAKMDETEVVLAIDRVEMARARANKVRLLMLYQMYQVLTPAQRRSLKALQEPPKTEQGDRLDKGTRQ